MAMDGVGNIAGRNGRPIGRSLDRRSGGGSGGSDNPGEHSTATTTAAAAMKEKYIASFAAFAATLNPRRKAGGDGHDHGNDPCDVVLIHGGQDGHKRLAYSPALVLGGLAGEWELPA